MGLDRPAPRRAITSDREGHRVEVTHTQPLNVTGSGPCTIIGGMLDVVLTLERRLSISLEHFMMRAGEVGEGLILLAEGVAQAWSKDRAEKCLASAIAGHSGPAFDEHILKPIQAEPVPWALGYSDPVADRVEARRREAASG